MDLTVRMIDAEPGSLTALHTRLRAAQGLRGRTRVLHEPPVEGEMGLVAELIALAIETNAVPTMFAVIALWIRQSRSQVAVRITDSNSGRSVEVKATNVEDVQGLMRKLLE